MAAARVGADVLTSEELKERAERVDVDRLMAWLGRAPTDLERGTPDWTYTHAGARWQVEVTSAATDFAWLRQLYWLRLRDDPSSQTTPSSSDAQLRGLSLETELVADELALGAAIRAAFERKQLMRYGHVTRTHLLIDASGQRVGGLSAVHRIAALCPLPAGYTPYADVVVVFAIEDWQRPLVALKRAP